MPVHTIIGADGKTYRVKVPEGVTQEQVAAKIMARTQPGQREAVRGRAGALAEGALWGWGDEASAGIASVMAKVTGDKRPLSSIYGDIRQVETTRQNQYEQENPGEALALQLAGGVATGGRALKQALPAGVQKNVAARTGALLAEGAIAGAGAADEGNRLEGAGYGAAASGVVGGLSRALGNTARGISRRRVAQDLQSGDKFIPLNVAADDSTLGKFYRNFLGRAWGSGKKLARQTEELMEPSVAKLARSTDKAKALKNTLSKEKGAARTLTKAATRRAKAELQSQMDARQMQLPKFDNAMRAEAAQASLPASAGEMREQVASMAPDHARLAMRKWWNKNGFKEVKENTFQLVGDLKAPLDIIKEELESNPEFKLELGEAGTRILGMASRAKQGALKNIEVTGGKVSNIDVDGDVLMAVRNAFARPSNVASESFKAAQQRGIVNRIDDAIIEQLPPDAAQRFIDDKGAYKIWSVYRKAAKGAFSGKGSQFDESDWLKAVQSQADADPDVFMVDRARSIQQATEAGKAADETTRRQIADLPGKEEKALNLALRKMRGEARTAEAQSRVGRAQDEVAALTRLAPQVNATGLSELLTTEKLGQATGFGMGNQGPIPWTAVLGGVGISQGLSSPKAQTLLAGQTEWQKAMAKALREREKELEALSRGIYRSSAMAAGDE